MGDEGNEEDLALMAKVARGDEDAFAKIVKKTSARCSRNGCKNDQPKP